MKELKIFIIVFIMICTNPRKSLAPESLNFWIVWNIGQGQWVTHILPFECRHYDFGGEIGSFNNIKAKLLSQCAQNQNKLYLSHWDYDHYLNLPALSKKVEKICWESKPIHLTAKLSIQKIFLLKLPNCSITHNESNKVIHWAPNFIAKKTNDSSEVFLDQNILLPGDSPQSIEKIWSLQISELKNVKILILGHHGSKTSTGNKLLSRLPNLKMTIASARFKKYGHPHQDVITRLKKNNLILLRTEDWGNIMLKL